ncbi:hypothetical protein [Komagataeibacter intermedius]|uniref:hypothetical protein n=1 Tax=Komagataeibacter intermedius TaxID=66229 RepID=UPI0013017805|nr:hypothetical protein [Komagataeibacter intermedius]
MKKSLILAAVLGLSLPVVAHADDNNGNDQNRHGEHHGKHHGKHHNENGENGDREHGDHEHGEHGDREHGEHGEHDHDGQQQ